MSELATVAAQQSLLHAIVGNPPYQDNEAGAKRNEPVYHHFIDVGAALGAHSCLIHPLKFLLDGGNTPKEWNERVRTDPHYAVPLLWEGENIVFERVGPKEGVCVTVHSQVSFTTTIADSLPTLMASPARDLARKVATLGLPSLADRMYSVTSYRLSEIFYAEVKEAEVKTPAASRGALTSNIFERFPEVFSEEQNADTNIAVYGKQQGKLVVRYLPARYLDSHPNLHKYKVLVQMAGKTTLVVGPNSCANQTFLTLGAFETEREARNAERYVNTYTVRTLVSAVQLSQFGNRRVWRGVPDVQDYTDTSPLFTGPAEELDGRVRAWLDLA